MKFRTFLILLGIFVFYSGAFGQSLKYKKFNFEWPAGPPKVIETNEQFKNEDVVIIDEKVDLFIYKMAFGIGFCKKYERLRFNTNKGISTAAHLVLPESLSPQADRSTLNINKPTLIHRPKGGYDCMDYFAARIIKPDGKIIPAVFDESVETEGFYINQIESKYYAFHFLIKNLEPGDDLEVYYGVTQIYDATNGFYFHGIYPKQHSILTISYNNKFSKYYFFEHNGAQSIKTSIDDNLYNEKLSWENNNLKACLDETGARPYKELPYVTFYKHDLNYGIWNDSRTVIQSYLPYTWDYVNLFFVRYRAPDFINRLSRSDKTTLAIRDFVNSLTHINDTSQLGKITAIHNEIVNRFNYQRDDDYISGEDIRLPRISEFLEKKTLRQISRYDIYNKVFERLEDDYYVTFMMDKRVNEISFDKYEGVISNDLYYAIIQNNQAHYLQPKFHRFGYYMNEFPYYYEDTKCILVPQAVPYEEQSKNVKKVKYAYLNTPYSSIGENVRNVNILTDLSFDSLTTAFKATIKLSGQFSTMTRGSYLYGFYDTTVTNQYATKIFDDLKGVANTTIQINSVDSIYPFKADITAQYSSKKIMEKQQDNLYAIDLGNWFKHIIDPKLSPNGRDLAFYPDFTSQDRFKYFLKFSSPVAIVSPTDPIEIGSDYGAYKFSIVQVQPDVLMVESVLVIKQEMVPATAVGELESIYTSIEKVNKSKLMIKKL